MVWGACGDGEARRDSRSPGQNKSCFGLVRQDIETVAAALGFTLEPLEHQCTNHHHHAIVRCASGGRERPGNDCFLLVIELSLTGGIEWRRRSHPPM